MRLGKPYSNEKKSALQKSRLQRTNIASGQDDNQPLTIKGTNHDSNLENALIE
jgi:hypothetical protein|tara:strand:+ start:88 stop:246 length:159 start_codon:yes stop_codon:yes gene_type:complete